MMNDYEIIYIRHRYKVITFLISAHNLNNNNKTTTTTTKRKILTKQS